MIIEGGSDIVLRFNGTPQYDQPAFLSRLSPTEHAELEAVTGPLYIASNAADRRFSLVVTESEWKMLTSAGAKTKRAKTA